MVQAPPGRRGGQGRGGPAAAARRDRIGRAAAAKAVETGGGVAPVTGARPATAPRVKRIPADSLKGWYIPGASPR